MKPFVDGLQETWHRLINVAAGRATTANARPWDLTSQLDDTTRDAIRRGQALYRAVFGPPDHGTDDKALVRLRHHLSKQRAQPLRILIKADRLYLPWNLLYIDGSVANNVPAFVNGFLGYRHRVVQQIEDLPPHEGYAPIGSRQPLFISLQRDLTLAIHTKLDTFLAQAHLTPEITVIHRDDHDTFVQALQAANVDDDILYFCCHGTRQTPSLSITQNKYLYPDDIPSLMGDGHFAYQQIGRAHV